MRGEVVATPVTNRFHPKKSDPHLKISRPCSSKTEHRALAE